MMSEKRKMEKKNKNSKENTMSYEEFDWMEMLHSGTLAKQRVCVLDKHIHNNHGGALNHPPKGLSKRENLD